MKTSEKEFKKSILLKVVRIFVKTKKNNNNIVKNVNKDISIPLCSDEKINPKKLRIQWYTLNKFKVENTNN